METSPRMLSGLWGVRKTRQDWNVFVVPDPSESCPSVLSEIFPQLTDRERRAPGGEVTCQGHIIHK